jgi:hypothetical protein
MRLKQYIQFRFPSHSPHAFALPAHLSHLKQAYTMLCKECQNILRTPFKSPKHQTAKFPHKASLQEIHQASLQGCRICKRLWREGQSYLHGRYERERNQRRRPWPIDKRHYYYPSTYYTIEAVHTNITTANIRETDPPVHELLPSEMYIDFHWKDGSYIEESTSYHLQAAKSKSSRVHSCYITFPLLTL